MKRLLTFLYLLLGFLFLNNRAMAKEPATGTPFVNLPDTACYNSFASTNAFFWKTNDAIKTTWKIEGGDYEILYNSDPSGTLEDQLPDPTYHRSALTIKFKSVGLYTITAKIYKSKSTYSTVVKTIYIKDCSILSCAGKNTGVGDFTYDFGFFKTDATKSRSDDYVPASGGASSGGYEYVSYTDGSNPTFADNSYTVFWHTQIKNDWVRTTDHTGGKTDSVGGMLIANSAIAKKTFFVRKGVTVCPGSSYNFSAWFLNINSLQVFNDICDDGNDDGYHYAGVSFLIINESNGDTLAKFKTFDVSMNLLEPTWQQYGGSFKTPGGVNKVTLAIVNDRLGDCGNDIAIDDISFKYCSPNIYSYIDGQDRPALKSAALCEGSPVTIKAEYDPNGWVSGVYYPEQDYFKNPIYQWEYSYNGTTWFELTDSLDLRTGTNTNTIVFKEGALVGDPDQPIVIYYRVNITEKGNASNCASPSEYTKITILPKPKVTVSTGRICKGEEVTLTASGGYTKYEWLVDPRISGPSLVVYPDTTTTYPALGIADYGLDPDTKKPRQCTDTGYGTIVVDTMPKVKITGGPSEICQGSSIALAIHSDNSIYDIVWNPAGTGTPKTVTFTDIPNKLDTNRYAVTVTNGKCSVTDSFKVKVYEIPIPKATAPPTQCDDGNFNLTATLKAGESGTWSLVTPDPAITIADPNAANTTITGVPAGSTVQVKWSVVNTGKTDCAHDTIIDIINQAAITGNTILTDQILCKLNDPRAPLTIQGPLTGGNGTFTYQWQRSINGGAWGNVGTGAITYTPPSPGTNTAVDKYRLIITSGTCTSTSNVVTVSVNTTPLTATAPANKTVECSSGTDYTTFFGEPTYNGFNATITSTIDANPTNTACTKVYTRTWTITDQCNATKVVTQTITVKDTKAPVFTYVPASDTTVSCENVFTVADVPAPIATDECSAVTITSSVSARTTPNPACASTYSYIITWTAKDDCGNPVSTQMQVNVEDKTAPTFTWAPITDTTVECDKVPPATAAGIPVEVAVRGVVLTLTVTTLLVEVQVPEVIIRRYLSTAVLVPGEGGV